MNESSPGPESTALVLAAHGSTRDPRINQQMFKLTEQIQRNSSFALTTPAFLDGSPNVRTIVNELKQHQIIVVPFMASAGYYTEVVFPEAFSDTGRTSRITPPIGEHPLLADLVDQRLNLIFGQHGIEQETTVVIVGHGTRKIKNSCRTTIDLVKKLRLRKPHNPVEFAFIDQNPDLNHVAGRVKTPVCVIIPFLMGLGPHATIDVPRAFGLNDLDDRVFLPEFTFPHIQAIENESTEYRTVILDAPVGSYPEWAEICVELAHDAMPVAPQIDTEAVG